MLRKFTVIETIARVREVSVEVAGFESDFPPAGTCRVAASADLFSHALANGQVLEEYEETENVSVVLHPV